MLNRTELEAKTLPELIQLCQIYGIRPEGNISDRNSCIKVLSNFPRQAILEFRKGRGLQYPKLNEVYNSLFAILRQLGQPTDAQLALMRATLQGQRIDKSTEAYYQAYYQTQMFRLWYIRQLIQQVLTLLQ